MLIDTLSERKGEVYIYIATSVLDRTLFSPDVMTLFKIWIQGDKSSLIKVGNFFKRIFLVFLVTGVATTLSTTIHNYLETSFWLHIFDLFF